MLIADALGVKGIWARSDPETVVQSWRSVIESVEAAIKQSEGEFAIASKSPEFDIGAGGMFLQAFSDTLIVAAWSNNRDFNIYMMTSVARRAFTTALKHGIYFRGVVSVGSFAGSQEDRLIIGPAVDEAAEWYGKPDWIGISAAPSLLFALEQPPPLERDPKFSMMSNFLWTKWDVPLSDGKQMKTWVLDWPRTREAARLGEKPDVLDLNRVLGIFGERPIGVAAFSKYENTLNFLRNRRAEMDRKTEAE